MYEPDGVLTIPQLVAPPVSELSESMLYHVVLPRLRNGHLVDYDERTGMIRYQQNPTFEALFEETERYRR
ncbi:hypothetical protein [Haladaptatus sp. DFWS20]|uniref:hypothetical protein n=1 Tax=Haladaptatus sp. DFWS20 TaxID=3403467 RepID=UPI003EBF8A52